MTLKIRIFRICFFSLFSFQFTKSNLIRIDKLNSDGPLCIAFQKWNISTEYLHLPHCVNSKIISFLRILIGVLIAFLRGARQRQSYQFFCFEVILGMMNDTSDVAIFWYMTALTRFIVHCEDFMSCKRNTKWQWRVELGVLRSKYSYRGENASDIWVSCFVKSRH